MILDKNSEMFSKAQIATRADIKKSAVLSKEQCDTGGSSVMLRCVLREV